MRIEPFQMERWQSTYEHQVACNLSESGVHPLTIRELLALPGEGAGLDGEAVLDTLLGYPQSNGEPELRERIAALYPGAGPDNVLVTHGGAEANLLSTLRLVEPGDEVVLMLPNYMQTPGLVRAWGGTVRPWTMSAEDGWAANPARLEELVNERTKLIIITTPNNPTGRIVPAEVLDAVAAVAERVGAWVLSDEVYRGAELEGGEAPSMWGRHERLLVTSGLSKAYGLPGLRTGWVASPLAKEVAGLWSYKDYTSISVSPLCMKLAAHALEPARRRALLERTRGILRRNLPHIMEWVEAQGDVLRPLAPEAGAILWVGYELDVGSLELAERLRVEEDTLIVAGAQLGVEGHLRLGFGPPIEELRAGLEGLGRVLESCRAPAGG